MRPVLERGLDGGAAVEPLAAGKVAELTVQQLAGVEVVALELGVVVFRVEDVFKLACRTVVDYDLGVVGKPGRYSDSVNKIVYC